MTQYFKNIGRLSRLSLGLAALLAYSATAQAEPIEIGKNSAVKGSVTIRSIEDAAKPAEVSQPVFLEDEVTSKAQSALQILLRDETKFTIGPDCVMVIDRFVYDPDRDQNALGATVKKGMFRFVSGKRGPGAGGPQIDTPTASLGIRGTLLEGVVGPLAIELAQADGAPIPARGVDMEGASLFALRGPGRYNESNDRKGEIEVTSGGKTVRVTRSGYGVIVVSKDLPPIGPFKVSDTTFEIFSSQLRTAPTGGRFNPFEIDPTFLRPPNPDAPDQNDDDFAKPEISDPFDALDFPSGLQDDVDQCTFTPTGC